MPLDLKLLENLLHQSEGTSLDFKSAQYPFDYANDGEKAELLKDILAFANSWRTTTAYILVGVEEVMGGRSNVVGVQTHLDDAILHQFVNAKTQRPVEFSYQVVPIKGTTIGVIEIPLQKRPTHLKQRFARLTPDTVFIRDGSSTRVATPDEIAKMGAEEILGATPQLEPRFRIRLVDGDGCEVGSIESVYCVFEPMSDSDIDDCIELLKSEFPIAKDFGQPEPAEKDGSTAVERIAGIKQLYTPASTEEIAKYTNQKYPKWIRECEEYLWGLHDVLQSEIAQPCFTIAIENEGTRPAKDALINVSASGGIRICPPPDEDDSKEKEVTVELSFPTPPQPPRGRRSLKSPSLNRLSSSMSALADPYFGIRALSHPFRDYPISLSNISRDNRRDPNAFYYKPGHSEDPKESFSLECEQWRHGTEEEHFSGQLFFGIDDEKAMGELSCEVHAENLPTPVMSKFPVEVSIKKLKSVDRARLLIQNLPKDLR